MTDPMVRFSRILCKYFRLEVTGLDHIPKSGPAVIIANHSGWMGLDALLLAYVIRTQTGRECRTMAHHGYFDWSKKIRELAVVSGLSRPKKEDAFETLNGGNLLIVFPEGEAGNFKSSVKKYQLQPFHKGFVHIATDALAPVIPCGIIGAEEAQLNLGSVLMGVRNHFLRIPLPLPIPPLPFKWRIHFFSPIPSETLIGFGATPYSRAAGVAESVRFEFQEKLLALKAEVRLDSKFFSETTDRAHQKSTTASSAAAA